MTRRILVIFNQQGKPMKSLMFGMVTVLLIMLVSAGCTESNEWDEGSQGGQASRQSDQNNDQRQRDERRSDENRSEDNTDESLETELGNAFNELGNALEELGEAFQNETSVEPVDYRDLREMLPASIRGMEKGRSEGERSGTLGFRISQVEQSYESVSGDAEVEISIVDLGGLKNIAAFGLEWLKMDVDRESDDGYERTRTYRGHPVLDKCERRGGEDYRCEMVAYVSRRFVVALKSKGLEKGSLEGIMEQVDVKRLEAMKDEGVE